MSTTNFMIIVDDICDGVWIDKLEVYEIDADVMRVDQNRYAGDRDCIKKDLSP